MRIGLLIYGRLGQQSGGYLYDRMLVQHLRRRGHDVQVVSLPWRGYGRHLADNFSKPLLQKLAQLKIDVLIQDELNHPSLFLLNKQLRNYVSYPIISIIHLLRSTEKHPALIAWFYHWVERRYLNSVDAFIFNSGDTRSLVEAQLSRKLPGIVATPGGDRLHPRLSTAQVRLRAQQRPLQILFLGNLIQRKRPDLLLAAAKPLDDRVHIHFAGRMDMEPNTFLRLRALAKGMPVTFHGHLDGAKLSALMGFCHVMALPSSYEGFGIAYLEALGFGLPVIGTRSGAAGEIIRHGKNGFLIVPGRAEELERVLRGLEEDRPTLVRLSLNALSSYKRHATWTQSLQRIEDFLSRYNRPSSPLKEEHMSQSTNRTIVIVLTLITATVHLIVLNLGGLQPMFILNGLGYLALLGAFIWKFPAGQERLVYYAFMAYAVVTIVAWYLVNGAEGFSSILGVGTKVVELLLIAFLWLDLRRAAV